MSETALQIAERIFASGRIQDPKSWEEMEVELDFELDELGVEGRNRYKFKREIHHKWYAKKKRAGDNQITTLIDTEIKVRFQDACEKNGATMSKIIRMKIFQYIAEEGQ